MKGKNLIITLCIVTICGLLAYVGFNVLKKDVTELKTEKVQTVEQSVASFIDAKNAYTVEQVYFLLYRKLLLLLLMPVLGLPQQKKK